MYQNIERQKEEYSSKVSELETATNKQSSLKEELSKVESDLVKLTEKNILISSTQKNIDEQLNKGYNFKNNLAKS